MPVCFKCFADIKLIHVFKKHLRFHGVTPRSKIYCIDDNCDKLEFSCMSNFETF